LKEKLLAAEDTQLAMVKVVFGSGLGGEGNEKCPPLTALAVDRLLNEGDPNPLDSGENRETLLAVEQVCKL
jgi:hypothetical protein